MAELEGGYFVSELNGHPVWREVSNKQNNKQLTNQMNKDKQN